MHGLSRPCHTRALGRARRPFPSGGREGRLTPYMRRDTEHE